MHTDLPTFHFMVQKGTQQQHHSMEANTRTVAWRVREDSVLSINVRVLPGLSSIRSLKFSLDPLVIHENQYCYIVFWKVLNYKINHTWKVKLLYILLTWYPGKENAFIFPPSNKSRHAIYFNWFNTHYHIKISWKVQLNAILPMFLSLKAVYHWDFAYSGNSATSLKIRISSSWWRVPHWFTLFPNTPVIFLTRHTFLMNGLLPLPAALSFGWFEGRKHKLERKIKELLINIMINKHLSSIKKLSHHFHFRIPWSKKQNSKRS